MHQKRHVCYFKTYEEDLFASFDHKFFGGDSEKLICLQAVVFQKKCFGWFIYIEELLHNIYLQTSF